MTLVTRNNIFPLCSDQPFFKKSGLKGFIEISTYPDETLVYIDFGGYYANGGELMDADTQFEYGKGAKLQRCGLTEKSLFNFKDSLLRKKKFLEVDLFIKILYLL